MVVLFADLDAEAAGPVTACAGSNGAILVLNAGSSSIKLAVFVARGGELALELRGAVEGLYTAPRFRPRIAAGRRRRRAVLGPSGARSRWRGRVPHDFLPRHLAGRRLVGVGHRVVHGGLDTRLRSG